MNYWLCSENNDVMSYIHIMLYCSSAIHYYQELTNFNMWSTKTKANYVWDIIILIGELLVVLESKTEHHVPWEYGSGVYILASLWCIIVRQVLNASVSSHGQVILCKVTLVKA